MNEEEIKFRYDYMTQEELAGHIRSLTSFFHSRTPRENTFKARATAASQRLMLLEPWEREALQRELKRKAHTPEGNGHPGGI